MSQELIQTVNRFEEDQNIPLKDLRDEVRQEISCRIHLLNYKDNDTLGVLDGSYSVYSFDGFSGVNKPYEFNFTFVSDEFIHIEDIVDTDVHVQLTDIVNPLVSSATQKCTNMQSKDVPLCNTYLLEISNNPASLFCFNL